MRPIWVALDLIPVPNREVENGIPGGAMCISPDPESTEPFPCGCLHRLHDALRTLFAQFSLGTFYTGVFWRGVASASVDTEGFCGSVLVLRQSSLVVKREACTTSLSGFKSLFCFFPTASSWASHLASWALVSSPVKWV